MTVQIRTRGGRRIRLVFPSRLLGALLGSRLLARILLRALREEGRREGAAAGKGKSVPSPLWERLTPEQLLHIQRRLTGCLFSSQGLVLVELESAEGEGITVTL